MYGNTLGLKKSQLHDLERVYRRRIPKTEIAHWEVVKLLCSVSREIRRQVGILVDRKGNILAVCVGENRAIHVPPKMKFREATGSRLSGFRFIHTHLNEEGITTLDLNELGARKLDLVSSIASNEAGFPGLVHVAHVIPSNGHQGQPSSLIEPKTLPELQFDFEEFILGLENDLKFTTTSSKEVVKQNRAILCGIRDGNGAVVEESLQETRELAISDGLELVDECIQSREKPDPKFMIGEGRLQTLLLRASQLGVSTLLFQQNLSPNQLRHLMDATSLRIIDRTQLILDIFAQRAKTHEGKLQVELAQLRYMFPRLREKEQQLSRLVGGIGGRGPGETKLEIHRRRARDRINRLEKEITQIAETRHQRRQLRNRRNVPAVSIVGYTNAGKTTLLNSLTEGNAFVEDRPFATLDPYSKRLRFPQEREIVLTDTVGFIRELPKDLYFAFRATLEEIGDADLLIHVVDVSKSDFKDRIEVVHQILRDLGFADIPEVLVFNKSDLLGLTLAKQVAENLQGEAVVASDAESCRPLLVRIEAQLWMKSKPNSERPYIRHQ